MTIGSDDLCNLNNSVIKMAYLLLGLSVIMPSGNSAVLVFTVPEPIIYIQRRRVWLVVKYEKIVILRLF